MSILHLFWSNMTRIYEVASNGFVTTTQRGYSPPVTPKERRKLMSKDKTIRIRVSEDELEKIKRHAEKCGYNLSQYCLSLALKYKPKALQSEDYLELLDEMRSFYDCVKDNEKYRQRYENLFLKLRTKAVK